MNMDYNGMINIFYPVKSLDQRRDIISFFHIHIVKAKCPENIVLCLSTMIFCDRHFIIVYQDNKIGIQFASGHIQSFHSLSARQRTITDHCDHISLLAL